MILWNNDRITVKQVVRSTHFMLCEIEVGGELAWVAFVYASNDQRERTDMWKYLEMDMRHKIGAWILLGDLNCIMDRKEKLNGNRVCDSQIEELRTFVDKVELRDIHAGGCYFTWNDKHKNPQERIWCKLDRAMANAQWIKQFEGSFAIFQAPGLPNHSPITVSWGGEEKASKEFMKVTKGMDSRVNAAKDAVFRAQEKSKFAPNNASLIEEEKCRALEYKKLKHNQLLFYKQRAKIRWAKKGDANTRSPVGSGAVQKTCQGSHRFGDLACKGMNLAYIALIPKVTTPEKPDEFQPISCCNVMYKILSSVLAGGLKEVCRPLSVKLKCAFVEDRSIIANICLAQQLLSWCGRKNISERVAWKIDLSKAYDSVSWKFLDHMMRLLKFPRKFMSWMTMCVQTAKYSILINGEMVDYFEGKRGLRQGDPLSSFLFTIVMEYLSRGLMLLSKKKATISIPSATG
ncbi:hypothetical protein QQ045_027381 [Rhodiola kirilowii]